MLVFMFAFNNTTLFRWEPLPTSFPLDAPIVCMAVSNAWRNFEEKIKWEEKRKRQQKNFQNIYANIIKIV